MKKVYTLSAAAAFGIAGAAMAFDSVVVDISLLNSNEFQGDALNEFVSIGGFSAGDIITSVDYDVNYTPNSPSWANEAVYSLWDGAVGSTLALDNSGGAFEWAGAPASSTPHAAAGNHDIADYVMTGSTLTVELHEWDFNDIAGGADATYGAGSFLTINFTSVPAPGALALLGIGGLAGFGRRRRA